MFLPKTSENTEIFLLKTSENTEILSSTRISTNFNPLIKQNICGNLWQLVFIKNTGEPWWWFARYNLWDQ